MVIDASGYTTSDYIYMTALNPKPLPPSRLRRPRLGPQLSLPFIGSSAAPSAGASPASIPRLAAPLALSGAAETRPPKRAVIAGRISASRPAGPRANDEIALEQALAEQVPKTRALALRLTDNRYTMVMVRRSPRQYTVRLHRMFAAADPRLLRALGRYVVANEPRASAVIGAFIEKHRHLITPQTQRERRVVLRTAGRTHDLQPIFDRLNQDYFDGSLQARITWGSAPRRHLPRRSIKMGSFAVEDRLIRIHPVLDDGGVPEFFVAWVVFHEMLHGKFEVVRKGVRRCFHSKEFLAAERSFREYHEAAAWERANMDRLLGPAIAD
jgi:hypothetical protein